MPAPRAVALADEAYAMPVELAPGEYEMLAWCGLGEGESFKVPQAQVGVTTIEELTCRMNRVAENGYGKIEEDLAPLFHGRATVTLSDEPGIHTETISLTKNTNVVLGEEYHKLYGDDIYKQKQSQTFNTNIL